METLVNDISELGCEAPVTVDKKILVEQITTLEQIPSEVFPPRQTLAGLHLVLELTDGVANVHIQLLHTGFVTIAVIHKILSQAKLLLFLVIPESSLPFSIAMLKGRPPKHISTPSSL